MDIFLRPPGFLPLKVRQFTGHHALILGNPRHFSDLPIYSITLRTYMLRLLSVQEHWSSRDTYTTEAMTMTMTHASTPGLHPPPGRVCDVDVLV
jgi:hypothetical protein